MNLKIEPIAQPERESLILLGVLDLESRDQALAEIGAALQRSAGADFGLVLSALTFVDSSGLSALVSLVSQARAMGKTIVLRDPTPALNSLLRLTALDQVFVIERAGQRITPQLLTTDPD